jgi:hypothetical protein
MANDEQPNSHTEEPDQDIEKLDNDHPYAAGVNDLLAAVANVVEKERFVEALSAWVNSHADGVKQKAFVQWRALATSVVFSLLIFAGLAVLAWNDKIPKEATTTLFGSLIGYWFGRSQSTKEH